jgi:hypothetical protein
MVSDVNVLHSTIYDLVSCKINLNGLHLESFLLSGLLILLLPWLAGVAFLCKRWRKTRRRHSLLFSECRSKVLRWLARLLLKLFAFTELSKTNHIQMALLSAKITDQFLRRNITFMSFMLRVTTVVARWYDGSNCMYLFTSSCRLRTPTRGSWRLLILRPRRPNNAGLIMCMSKLLLLSNIIDIQQSVRVAKLCNTH